jgi:branched-chain amino acid transport system substrate-binding protein
MPYHKLIRAKGGFKMKRIVQLAVVMLVAVLILLPGNSKAAGKEIVIGFLNELTGFMAPAGIPGMQGVKTMLEVKGYKVDGRPIKLVVEDTGCEPAQALDKVRKLVEVDKACIIVGPIFGGTHLAIAPYLDKVKVPALTIEGNWESAALDNKWSWIVSGGLIQHNYQEGIYAYKVAGYKTATILFPDYAGGPNFYEGFRRGFTESGGKIVQEQFFPVTTKDFTPYLLALKPADVLAVFPVGEATFAFYKAVNDLKLKIPILGGPDEMGNPAILNMLKGGPPGLLISVPYFYTMNTPGNKEFVKAYQKQWKELPGHTSGSAAAAMQVALEAIRKAGGDTSGPALAKALGTIDMETIRGRITMTPDRVGTVSYSIASVVKKADGTYTYKILKTTKVSCKKVGNKLTYAIQE